MLRSMPYDGYEISFKEVKTVVDGEKQEQFPEQLAKYYTVQSGDTFGVIANRNGLALDQLVKLNPQISNIHLIYAGQILRVG